jgi:hypothetical protein
MMNAAALNAVALSIALAPDLTGVTGGAAPGPGRIDFSYAEPDVSDDGQRVSWHWTLTNLGGKSVTRVVFIQNPAPVLKFLDVSPECAVNETAIRCEYGTLGPGARRGGILVARMPKDLSGDLHLSGRASGFSAASS